MGLNCKSTTFIFLNIVLMHPATADPLAFTTNQLPLNHVPSHVKICRLEKDAPDADPLAFHSPAQLLAWTENNASRLQQFEEESNCEYQAAFLGITKLPAVVNKQYVVYGTQNVKKALIEIKEFEQRKKKMTARSAYE